VGERGQKLLQLSQQADALRRENKLSEAIPILEQLLSEQPDWEHGNGWFDLSSMYQSIGQNLKALECAARARPYQPGSGVFDIHYADLASRFGDADDACDTLVAALAAECQIYSNPNFKKDREEILRIVQQIITRSTMDGHAIRARLDKACPSACDIWANLTFYKV
jgi:tetratricopeptide (TPR) repeat protein